MQQESQETLDEKKAEPQITSSDPEERKLARRLRIQRRNESIRRVVQLAEGVTLEEEGPKQTPLEGQVEKSAIELERLLLEGRELVTNVRIANDSREVARRLDEAEKRRARIQRLEDDVESTKGMYEEVEKKWKELSAASDPMDLKAEIDCQKEKCEELLKRKDEVIRQLRVEVDEADTRFMKDQQKQKRDIAILVERIENHVRVMKESFRNELQFIEDAISVERAELIESTNEQWHSLYDQREEQETTNLALRFQDIDSQETEVDALRTEYREKYRQTKIKLETELQDMRKEMEKIKSCCLLNSEKLDYNYQVLQKREEENLVMRTQQKRRLNKLQDTLTNLRRKIRTGKLAAEQEAARLDVEVNRLHDNILDTERKADYFANINDRKYHQVWDLNECAAKALVERIFSIDKIISEQQLGVDWESPDTVIPEKTSLPSFRSAMQLVSEVFDKESKPDKSDPANGKNGKETDEEKRDEEKKILKKDDRRQTSAEKRRSGSSVKIKSEDKEADEMHCKAVRQRLMKHILQRVADASGFLVETRLQKLLNPYSPPEKAVVLLDNVFDALGLRFEADVELLKEYFIPYAMCTECPPPKSEPEIERKVKVGVSQVSPEGDSADVPPACVESFEAGAEPLRMQPQAESFTTTELRECRSSSAPQGEMEGVREDAREPQIQIESRPGSISSADTFRELPVPERGEVLSFQQSDIVLPTSRPASAVAAPQQADSLLVASGNETASLVEPKGVLPLPACPVPPAKKCVECHDLEIEPIYVYMALNDFVSKFHNNEMADLQSIARILARKRNTVSRLLTNEDTVNFWNAYKTALPIEQQRLWSGFLKGLNKYYHVLSERHKLNVEAMSLQRQNDELKQLLSNYTEYNAKSPRKKIQYTTLPPLHSSMS